MKVAEILSAEPVLRKLAAGKLPISVSYKLLPVVEAVEEIIAEFKEERNEAVTLLGKKSEEGETVTVTPENEETFKNEIQELLSADVDLPPVKISISAIEDTVDLSMAEVKQIAWLLEL